MALISRTTDRTMGIILPITKMGMINMKMILSKIKQGLKIITIKGIKEIKIRI